MKKTACFAALALAASIAAAEDAFTFVNDGDYGYSYIQINQDLASFKFKSDWHSLGNAGRVGYVVYPSDLKQDQLASYMAANANNPQFRKSVNDGVVDLGELKAGDRVALEPYVPDFTCTQTAFKEWKDNVWLAFDKNGGNGKDESMSITDIAAQAANSTSAPSGAPLPGALAALLVGGIGAGALRFGKRKQA